MADRCLWLVIVGECGWSPSDKAASVGRIETYIFDVSSKWNLDESRSSVKFRHSSLRMKSWEFHGILGLQMSLVCASLPRDHRLHFGLWKIIQPPSAPGAVLKSRLSREASGSSGRKLRRRGIDGKRMEKAKMVNSREGYQMLPISSRREGHWHNTCLPLGLAFLFDSCWFPGLWDDLDQVSEEKAERFRGHLVLFGSICALCCNSKYQ